jgi:outer membrane protein TolC
VRRPVITVLVSTLAFAVGMTDPTAASDAAASDVATRLVAAQRAAIAQAPGLLATRSELAAEAAAYRLEAASGSPYVEWQSEGLSGSGRQANATDYLRLGTPFNLPGQIGRARALVRSAGGWVGDAVITADLTVAAETSRRWLAVAVAVEREALSSARLERLDAALNLQEARYQLGEIAGTEVRQLDLEHVGESSRLASIRGELAVAEAALHELCGDDCGEVRHGDLESLVAASRTPEGSSVSDDVLAAGPLLRRSASEAELARNAADLIAATAWGRAEVEAEWERVPAVDGMPSFDAWGLRVSVPLPVGAAGHRQRELARARANQALAELEASWRQVRRSLAEELAVADGAAARLRALEPALGELDFTDHSLAEQFRLGAISYLAYIDGLSRFDRIIEQAIDARLALVGARLELAVLLGDPLIFPLPEIAACEED